ncbi:hypothetical protein GCM10023210_10270 [Chryseobacterium ginsengisoli]|uniref:DUF5655 domain-containing protein n=2 Tax=Chryseobacterium ginsengisoli TaxID=363853 RepID=A0ABP9LXE9_9FLAO
MIMETDYKTQQRSQYAEVYISDIPQLKNIFLEIFKLESVNENFGIPFLILKKGSNIAAFASLFIKDNKIDFQIYQNSDLTINERAGFEKNAESYFRQNNSANFRDVEQLKSSIIQMIDWLNI